MGGLQLAGGSGRSGLPFFRSGGIKLLSSPVMSGNLVVCLIGTLVLVHSNDSPFNVSQNDGFFFFLLKEKKENKSTATTFVIFFLNMN